MPSRTSKVFAGLVLSAASLLAIAGGGAKVSAAQAGKADSVASAQSATGKQAATTTEKDQTDLSVTVYNSNVALVRDVRQIPLQSGVFPLRFEDVAASINPVTVHFRSLTDASKLNVVEQNYEYDLLDPQKLLQKYVGREVWIRMERRGDERAAAFGQQRPDLESEQSNRHRIAGRHLPLSRTAGQSLQQAHACMDAR